MMYDGDDGDGDYDYVDVENIDDGDVENDVEDDGDVDGSGIAAAKIKNQRAPIRAKHEMSHYWGPI